MGGGWSSERRCRLALLLGFCTLALPLGGAARYAAMFDHQGEIVRLGGASETDFSALLLVGLALVLAAAAGALARPVGPWRVALGVVAVAALGCGLVLAVGVYDAVGPSNLYGVGDGGAIRAARWGLAVRFGIGGLAVLLAGAWTMRSVVGGREDGGSRG